MQYSPNPTRLVYTDPLFVVASELVSRRTFHFPEPEQFHKELRWFADNYIAGCKAVLEIGSGSGGLLAYLAAGVGIDGRAKSISLPRDEDEAAKLAETISELRLLGYNVETLRADSRSREAVAWATENGPYDLVFIDGEHDDAFVRSDWENYSPLGRIVALHDIDNEDYGTVPFWAELKKSHVTEECIAYPGYRGIGVVCR